MLCKLDIRVVKLEECAGRLAFQKCIYGFIVFLCMAIATPNVSAQGLYWEAINDGGFYASSVEACLSSHQSYAANENITPNDFLAGYSNDDAHHSMRCKWERGESGYWGRGVSS